MGFSILIGILIFLLSIADDILVVFYLRRIVRGDRLTAALLSGVITGIVCLEVVLYAPEPIYIVFNAAGSVIGTPFAMYLDDKLPRRPRRDEKGRFKPIPVIAKEPL